MRQELTKKGQMLRMFTQEKAAFPVVLIRQAKIWRLTNERKSKRWEASYNEPLNQLRFHEHLEIQDVACEREFFWCKDTILDFKKSVFGKKSRF